MKKDTQPKFLMNDCNWITTGSYIVVVPKDEKVEK